ncbi:hypothetical protein DVH24_012333 [Malus domestica]|uniref:Aspartate aminotransferase n=1 Tax=Malus domestica TaxID=3750 RepID=A0A498HP32_MALDO|nr:hypothetical protein DVH24_012333 [Malus domestica]
MVISARCCLSNSMRVLNLFVNSSSTAFGSPRNGKLESLSSLLSQLSLSPGMGIAVCLSTLCGHIVAHSVSSFILFIVSFLYIIFVFCLLCLEVGVIVSIFFRMDWEVQFAKYIDEDHTPFKKFLRFHLNMCRIIVQKTPFFTQFRTLSEPLDHHNFSNLTIKATVLGIILWAIGSEPRTEHFNSSDVTNFRYSFLAAPTQSLQDISRHGFRNYEVSSPEFESPPRPSLFSNVQRFFRMRFHRRVTLTQHPRHPGPKLYGRFPALPLSQLEIMASEHGGSAFANIPQVPEATIPVTPYGNHLNFFNAAGLAMKTYRYYDPRTHGLDFEVPVSATDRNAGRSLFWPNRSYRASPSMVTVLRSALSPSAEKLLLFLDVTDGWKSDYLFEERIKLPNMRPQLTSPHAHSSSVSTSSDRRLSALVRHLAAEEDQSSSAMDAHNNSISASPASAHANSVFAHVVRAPEDPILGVTVAYNKDPSPLKLNLGVGAYRTEEGKPLVLNVVRKAEQLLVNDMSRVKEYLPIVGLADFNKLSAKLILGADSPAIQENRITTVQCLSGTGSLRVGGEFLARHYHERTIYIPLPTWGNHTKVFTLAGLTVKSYRYYDPATRGLNFQGLLEDLSSAPAGAIVLLHACAHNPTGVDPTLEQWEQIRQLVRSRGLLPFFDSAYQGFASGSLDGDAQSVRRFAADGGECLIAQSYAKNMGLYGERVGALSIVCKNADVASKVESQLKLVIRPMYSNPPIHGASIVATILKDRDLFNEWTIELKAMADRIISMRHQLFESLRAKGTPGDWSHIIKQIGMFTFTGLNSEQVAFMTKEYHIYMTSDGRISMAGLSSRTVPHLTEAIHAAVTRAA